ncbi:oligosaccharide repeat unit polymerase [Parafrankia sp. BMG5.11]|nr:oligosaccharide repeat unit polymerase [Parafrankia sp. BMG5.11]
MVKKGRDGETVPRYFQITVLLFLLLTGAVPQLLQATFNGMSGGSGFAPAVLTSLVYDLVRIAPLLVLARHPAGILHPIIVAVVVWPLLTTLPNLIDSFGGYAGLLSGQPLKAPYFTTLGWKTDAETWSALTQYRLLQIASLISLYTGFAIVRRDSGRRITILQGMDSQRLRRILVGVIIVNLFAVAVFVQTRGGLVEHVIELAYGRFRALAGLGPLLALFDIGFLALLLWICTRPQDSRHPLFLVLLPLVAAQQFIVAGSRSAALLVVVLTGLGWALSARRVPWRLALILLPIAFLSFGALNLIRTAGLTNTTLIEAAGDADLGTVLQRSQEEFDLRQSLSGAVPIIADGMRTTGPMFGYTYSGALFAVIPRTFWPEKPRGPGSLYAQHFLGESVEGTAVPIGAVAEAFWNFHAPGVIVLFALYGWILRRGLETYNRNPRNGAVIAGFVLLATQFGVGTDELVAFQQLILTGLLLFGIIALFYPRTMAARRSSGTSARQTAVR